MKWSNFIDFGNWVKEHWVIDGTLSKHKPKLVTKPVIKHGMSKKETERMMRENTGASYLGQHSR